MANLRQKQTIPLNYQPRKNYDYNVEIFSVANLRQRCSDEMIQRTYIYQCDMVILNTGGNGTLWLDFEPYFCQKGTVMWVKKGQAHSFGKDKNWEGWVMMINYLPELNQFSQVQANVQLTETDFNTMKQGIVQLKQDCQKPYSPVQQQLIHHQCYALLWRLASLDIKPTLPYPPRLVARFEKFCQLLDRHFYEWHQVKQYAEKLACSEKSLNRACVLIRKQTAKTLINQRIILGAKRQLVHAVMSIVSLSEQLGFNEPTHFVKFFKRETGMTPQRFKEEKSLGKSTALLP